MTTKTLTALAAATALSATALAAGPTHAGPLGFLKKIVKQELTELAQETVENATDAAAGAVVSKVAGKARGEPQAPATDNGFRQEGGTTVPSADDVQTPQGEARGLLLPAVQPSYQARVNVVAGDVTGDGKDGKPGTSQNGTTVPAADTVSAGDEERRGLLLPAVQKVAPAPRPQAGTTQNGTTAPTAEDVAAPKPPKRGRMVQNGTTVETASDVQAPQQGE